MEYEQFYKASQNLEEFIREQEKLDAVLKVIAPSSTAVCEFGNKFIDDYINVVEIALNDTGNWFSWFVFDNDFGRKKLTVNFDGEEFVISDEKTFFEIIVFFKT